ncbi:hypothetical protein SAMN05660686_01747 [Thalassobaculum litoreum DSM 18839]|uniref:Uncharacterized protein n=1 Tax=Thalassobaculum litoreum DSM 18839 TaxID=1123362 RepID=A0A8G2BGN5_9PROT|nr:hypothetical protein SAMN05660686_01747 [Thalassobaculum litoreum DSM 18839]
MAPDTEDDSKAFGLWPTIAGFAFAAAIFVSMFVMATGFA